MNLSTDTSELDQSGQWEEGDTKDHGRKRQDDKNCPIGLHTIQMPPGEAGAKGSRGHLAENPSRLCSLKPRKA